MLIVCDNDNVLYCVISDDADLFGSPVIEECPENQDFSVCPGHQNSSPAPHTAKVLSLLCVYIYFYSLLCTGPREECSCRLV